MTDPYPPGFAWAPAFIAALGSLRTVKAAAAACGISPGTAYYLRDRNPAFAAEWQAALRPPASVGAEGASAGLPARIYGQTDPGWRTRFLEALAETSNVTASAARAGVPVGTAYKARRQDRAFAARWRKALHEGYDNLEMEVLGHLRDPRQSRKMDVAAVLKLLAAHRETIASARAEEDDEDEQAVFDSIDRFIGQMRERRLANEALLAQDDENPDE